MTLWIDKIIDANRAVEKATGDVFEVEKEIKKLVDKEFNRDDLYVKVETPTDGYGSTTIQVAPIIRTNDPLYSKLKVNDCPLYIEVTLPYPYTGADKANLIDKIVALLKEEI